MDRLVREEGPKWRTSPSTAQAISYLLLSGYSFSQMCEECVLLNPIPRQNPRIFGSDIGKVALAEEMEIFHERQNIGLGRGICRNSDRKITCYCLGCSMLFGQIIRICDNCWDEVHDAMREVPEYNSKG